MIVAPGTTGQSIDVFVGDDGGLAVTGLTASTFPAVSYSLGNNTAAVAITLSDLAAITSAYSSGGLKERSGGWYRLDLPAGALAATATVKLIGDATGKHLLCEPIVVANVPSDLQTVKTQTVTAAGAVTINANVGFAGTPGASNGGLRVSDYTAPDNADVAAALGDLVTLLARADTAANVAAVKAVTDRLAAMLSGSTPDKFTGPALSNAPTGGGGDPWATALPGGYPDGTAGKIVGTALGPDPADVIEIV